MNSKITRLKRVKAAAGAHASRMARPLVSVLMPAFNRERFVGAAIASILRQSLSDLELIVVDDGSEDATPNIVASVTDRRVRLIRHGSNLGISAARNSALDAATGRYVAWLDSDDVARPTRLERQVQFLERHPKVALVGASAGKIDSLGKPMRGLRVPPVKHDEIRCWLLFKSAFQQSSLMGRREIADRFRYRTDLNVCEDIELAQRIAAEHEVANLPAVLVDRRMHCGQIGRKERDRVIAAQALISGRQLDELGFRYGDDDLRRHCLLARATRSKVDQEEIDWAVEWVARLRRANERVRMFDPSALRFVTDYLLLDLRRRKKHPGAALAATLLRPGLISWRSMAWSAAAIAALLGNDFSSFS